MLPLLAKQGWAGRHCIAALGAVGLGAAYSMQPDAVLADATVKPKALDSKALDSQEFRSFKVVEKEKLTHNTWRLRFELPDNKTSGMFVASCLVTRAMLPEGESSKAVIRPYTPTSPPEAQGYMDLVVKGYDAGKMSKHITSLKVGDTLEMKGPIPKLPYTPNMKQQLGMVAGGTGITPMLQVIHEVLKNPADKTRISLVYANVNPSEIILKKELDDLAAAHPDRFTVYYVVDNPGWQGLFWKGGKGYITRDMLEKQLPPPDNHNLIMVCGPPGMMNLISGNKAKDFSQGELTGLLKDMGYTPGQVFKF